ncbi:MAG: rhombosortase [bacterium]|nr:rhombosortase [bacterium]
MTTLVKTLPAVDQSRSTAWLSLLLSLVAAALFLTPRLSAGLAFERSPIGGGELWRLVAGHWVHFTFEHLFWSLLVFAVLGVLWEKAGQRWGFLACVVCSAVLISAALWWLQPQLTSYRGLSGIDCALVTAMAVQALRQALASGRRELAIALALAILAYFAKVAFEFATGGKVFVSDAAPFEPVPLAHLIGGLWGITQGWLARIPVRGSSSADSGGGFRGPEQQPRCCRRWSRQRGG